MAGERVFKREPCPRKYLRVQIPRVVDDDDDRCVLPKLTRCVGKRRSHVGNVRVDRTPARATARCSDLILSPITQAEKLIRVTMLIVVVDEPRVRRRRDYPVRSPGEA